MPSRDEGDLPKTVAVIMTSIPSLTIRTGWAYLRTKRRVRQGSRYLMKGMLESGMPEDLAHMLADQYESDISIRNLFNTLRGSSSSWTGRESPK